MTQAFSTVFSDGLSYVWLFLYLFVAALLESSKHFSGARKRFAALSMCIMALFIGLRWETGTDWDGYKSLFDTLQLKWSSLFDAYHFDIGYVLFNALVKLFTDSYTLFLLVNSFVTIYVLYRFVRKISPYPNLSLFFFYSAFMVAQFMGSNRRMMAMVFLLWAFYYLFRGSKKKYFGLVLLAFLFHNSALIGLLALFVPQSMYSVQSVLAVFACCFIAGLLQLPFKAIALSGDLLSKMIPDSHLIEKISYYSQTNDRHLVSSTGSVAIHTTLALVKRGVFLIFYWGVAKKHAVDKLAVYLLNIYIFGLAGYLLLIGTFFQMLTAYFALIEIVLLGRMYSYTSASTKIVMLGVLFAFTAMQLVSALNVYPELYMPYISCFSNMHR
jgi:hypothetical protein